MIYMLYAHISTLIYICVRYTHIYMLDMHTYIYVFNIYTMPTHIHINTYLCVHTY